VNIFVSQSKVGEGDKKAFLNPKIENQRLKTPKFLEIRL